MCGISGAYCFSDARPSPDLLKALLLANQTRGQDAAGLAWFRKNAGIMYAKNGVKASRFIEEVPDAEWAEIAQSRIVLLHARAATKGKETTNANNHPVVGLDWVVVHNGHVGNDDALWGALGSDSIKRFAEVDSSAIPLVLSQGNTDTGVDMVKSLSWLSLLGGTATLAAWSTRNPDHLILGRVNGPDLYLFMDPRGILYWSSASIASHVIPGFRLGGSRFTYVSKLADDRAMLLTPEGPEACKTYVLDRRPFYPAVRRGGVPASSAAVTPTSKALPAAGGQSNTPSNLPEQSTPSTKGGLEDYKEVHKSGGRFRWSDRNKDRFGSRPRPTLENLFNGWFHYPELQHNMRSEREMYRTIGTLYGNWSVYQDLKSGVFERIFKPHKKVKNWHHRVVRGLVKDVPKFPVVITRLSAQGEHLAQDFHVLDSKMRWDRLTIFTKLKDRPEDSASVGYVCPWCGVWGHWMHVFPIDEKGTRTARCRWCNISSDAPAHVG